MTMTKKNMVENLTPDRRFYGLMILTTVFWGGAFPAGKIVSSFLEPATASFIRFLVALPFFFILLIIFGESYKISRKNHLKAAIFGIMQITLYNFLFFKGLQFTSSSNATLIIASGPAMTTVMAALFLEEEKIDREKVLGIVLAFIGVALIVLNGSSKAEGSITGDLIISAAALVFAIYTIFARYVLKELTPLQLTSWGTVYGVLALFILSLFEGKPDTIDSSLIIAMIYLSLFAGVFGFLFYNIGTKHIGASKAAIFINLVPVFGVVTSIIVLGEILLPIHILTFLLIAMGVYLVNRPKQIQM